MLGIERPRNNPLLEGINLSSQNWKIKLDLNIRLIIEPNVTLATNKALERKHINRVDVFHNVGCDSL